MKFYILKNQNGEYFSPRNGRCSLDFNPFSHLFKELKSAKANRDGYSENTKNDKNAMLLHIEEVEIGIITSKII